jgi:hypothetical protein
LARDFKNLRNARDVIARFPALIHVAETVRA